MRTVYAAILLMIVSWSLSAQSSDGQERSSRFVAVDVFVDSNNQPLAAYQLEFVSANRTARIVGIEGGEHPAFVQPPYYDPKAMQGERVIIAAFSTNAVAQLPSGRTRVATIHIQADSAAELKWNFRLHTAASVEGRRLKANVTAEERKQR
jgi:hypothetical protein